jgi:hypothetical protein
LADAVGPLRRPGFAPALHAPSAATAQPQFSATKQRNKSVSQFR